MMTLMMTANLTLIIMILTKRTKGMTGVSRLCIHYKELEEAKKMKNKQKSKSKWLRFLLIGLTFYGLGIHNVDLGHNTRVFEAKYGLSLIDTTNQFTQVNATEMYITGINQVKTSFESLFWIGLGVGVLLSILLGYALGGVFNDRAC